MPFSNATEFDIWHFNMCEGGGSTADRCIKDDDAETGDGCPLILQALIGERPNEWVGEHGRYQCTAKATDEQAQAKAKAEERKALEDAHYPMFPLPDITAVIRKEKDED